MANTIETARALAVVLTRTGIPAQAVRLPREWFAARIHLTIGGEAHTLYLEPLDRTVVWQLHSESERAFTGYGTWTSAPSRWRGPHRHTVRHLRTWLRRNAATLGHPTPPVPSIESLIDREAGLWEAPYGEVTAAVAESITTGALTLTDDTAAMVDALAALHPELTDEYGLTGPDGWTAGINNLRALANGWIADLASDEDQSAYDAPCYVDVQYTSPDDVQRLRDAFGGDVLAAARAYLAHTITY
ncbi:hypothetical protein ACFVVA_36945 [Kitasatospora sp. NPDC058048]|uniref:hypothetical protein n=1 Tax=Kitasatospora sp. NPDC058048 TaxID=3346313 RepID=UPI0036DD0424